MNYRCSDYINIVYTNEKFTRNSLVCLTFGHPTLTSSFTNYKFAGKN